jgi:hypothetical protein
MSVPKAEQGSWYLGRKELKNAETDNRKHTGHFKITFMVGLKQRE